MFIDGFAGPGEYSRGEPGSPVIALDAAIEHKADLSSCELIYIFIEQDDDRFRHLEKLLSARAIPKNVRCHAVHGTFAEHLSDILNTLEEAGKEMAPAFVMIDPFGFAGMPLRLIARVAAYRRTELLISFMYESIVRWRAHPNLDATFDELFGCHDWREAERFTGAAERKDFLLDLYIRQLKTVAQMEYARAFEMIDRGNRTEYFLIFATHHIDGVKAMKSAMWSVDPAGSFQFSDATVSNQLTLFEPQPNFDLLKRLIVERFAGQEATIQQIERFVVVDTPFRESHFKRQILAPLEKERRIVVTGSLRTRAMSYPAGTVIRFP